MKSWIKALGREPLWLYAIAFAALFMRFGYNYADGDLDEVLPFLMSIVDPSLFKSDWFVQSQLAEVSVRSYVVWLLLPISRLLSVETATHTLYIGSWLLIATGTFRVADRLLNNKVAAALAVFASLGVFHKWTLGSNEMVYTMFVGEMLAWGLASHALHQWLLGRDKRSALLLGIAAWFQLLVGLHFVALLAVERLWDRATAPKGQRRLTTGDFATIGLFVLAALPAIVPVAIQQFDARGTDNDLIFYILATFRNPFHHLFLSFGLRAMIKFSALAIVGLVGYFTLSRRELLTDNVRIGRLIILIITWCVLTFLFTEVWSILLVAKLQGFKMTVLLKFLFVTTASGWLISALPRKLLDVPNRVFSSPLINSLLTAIVLTAIVVLVMRPPEPVQQRLAHLVHRETDLGRMEAWIRDSTLEDELFAVPPSNATFRSSARRAIVVNYAAFPFDDATMVEWFDRLLAVAPIEPPVSGMGVKPVLDAAFHAQTQADWLEVSRRFGVDYLLVDSSQVTHALAFETVHQQGSWTLYRLS